MKKNKNSIPKEKKGKIEEAKKNFSELWKKVEPFIKKRTIKTYSTTGRWRTFDHGL